MNSKRCATRKYPDWMEFIIYSFVMTIAGCGAAKGPDRAAVQGQVMVSGERVERGSITFIPLDGGPTSGSVIEDGRYSIAYNRGLSVGEHTIQITGRKLTGRKLSLSEGGTFDEMIEIVPEKYSGKGALTREIKSGLNTLDFDLDK